MPHVQNGSIRIHYEKEPGPEPALLLVHGFTYSGQSFYKSGYVAALKGRHALLIPDLPAHGQSDKPHDVASYTPERVVAALLAVLDAERVERAVYWGYSLGTILGFAAATLSAERFCGFVLGGEQPYGTIDDWPVVYLEPLRAGMESYLSFVESRGAAPHPSRREQLLKSDGQALACFAEAAQGYLAQPNSPSRLSTPALLYAGTRDPSHRNLRRAAAAAPRARFVELAELDHGQGFTRCERVMEHVMPFLAELGA
jgi:pimeloyl-ACP methyl ester carboxylesterase